uniref:GATOR complex protein NPRL3 n=1 Tax=Parascaris univalens TaxID=6257 RepID=A0A915C965_PARUN
GHMDEERYLYAPLGLMFITTSENHEQVSFTYPFSYDQSSTRSDAEHPLSLERGTCAPM